MGTKDNQELVWVDRELAERLKALTTAQATRDQHEAVFNEYLEKIAEEVRREFRASLEGLEEDAAMFTGLMLKVKQAFGKAKSEYLNSSYELWEKFEADLPSVQKKTEAIINVLNPLKKELTEINELLRNISVHDIDRLRTSIDSLAEAHGKQKEMVEFLVTHFGKARA